MTGLVGTVVGWLLTPRARIAALVVVVLGVALAIGRAEWRRAEAEARAVVAESALREVERERDAARTALEQVERERARAREAARTVEARQATIRREVAILRQRLAGVTDARQRCEAALEEVRRELRR